MSDKSGPAYPVPAVERSDGMMYHPYGTEFGLTKRELFAAMAMQGLLANLADLRREGFSDWEISSFAVLRADALIAELQK